MIADLTQLVRFQSIYHSLDGILANDQMNTFYVATNDAIITALGVANEVDPLWDAFTDVWDGFMSDDIFDNSFELKAYNMLDAEPRVPIADAFDVKTLNSTTASLPREVTMCVSYHANPVSGEDQARRRGRIFLPTFVITTTAMSGTQIIWDPTERAAVRQGIEDFGSALWASANGLGLAVFSPTTFNESAGTTLERLRLSTNWADAGWVDDEPDTQRRRGRQTGARSAFAFS